MARKYITITYEVWDEEAVEAGDTDDRGFIDEEGEDMAPDKWDREEGLTVIDKTVEYLLAHGAYEPSEWGPPGTAAPRWWTNYEHSLDFRTGERENRSYHLQGFSHAERQEIFRRMELMR